MIDIILFWESVITFAKILMHAFNNEDMSLSSFRYLTFVMKNHKYCVDGSKNQFTLHCNLGKARKYLQEGDQRKKNCIFFTSSGYLINQNDHLYEVNSTIY